MTSAPRTSRPLRPGRRHGIGHPASGFTLLELLLVLILMGTVAAVAATAYRPSAGDGPLPAYDRLAADLRYAQGQAMQRAADHRVVLDGAGYRLEEVSGPGCGSESTAGELVRFRTPFGQAEGSPVPAGGTPCSRRWADGNELRPLGGAGVERRMAGNALEMTVVRGARSRHLCVYATSGYVEHGPCPTLAAP